MKSGLQEHRWLSGKQLALPDWQTQHPPWSEEGVRPTMPCMWSVTSLPCIDGATVKLLPDFPFLRKKIPGGPKVWHDQVFLPSDRRVLALDRHTGKILWAFDEFGGDLAVGGGKVFCRQAASNNRNHNAAKRRAKKDESVFRVGTVKLATWMPDAARFWSSQTIRRRIGRLSIPRNTTALLIDLADLVLKVDSHLKAPEAIVLSRMKDFSDGPIRLSGSHHGASRPQTRFWELPWQATSVVWQRHVGENLIAFRAGDGGLLRLHVRIPAFGNLDSFRPACTAGYDPADGRALRVERCHLYSRYSHLYPLALIQHAWSRHVDLLSPQGETTGGQPVKQLGINFGAPGDRLAENNTLWLEYRLLAVRHESGITTEPATPQWFRITPSRAFGKGSAFWVCRLGRGKI